MTPIGLGLQTKILMSDFFVHLMVLCLKVTKKVVECPFSFSQEVNVSTDYFCGQVIFRKLKNNIKNHRIFQYIKFYVCCGQNS